MKPRIVSGLIIVVLLIASISSAQQFGPVIKIDNPIDQLGDVVNPPEIVDLRTPTAIYFSNNCVKPVELVIRYQRLDGEWETLGWYPVAGWHSTYLNDPNGNIIRTNNLIIYYYAKSTDGRLYWGGDQNRTFEGESLPMYQETLNVDKNFGITCPLENELATDSSMFG
jgi:hypothetical protein